MFNKSDALCINRGCRNHKDKSNLFYCSEHTIKPTRMFNALDVQVGGQHYKVGIQPTQFSHANHLSFEAGNVIKYVSRWRNKNGIQDLKKALHYVELLHDLCVTYQTQYTYASLPIVITPEEFCESNDIIGKEADIIEKACMWNRRRDQTNVFDNLLELHSLIKEYIEQLENEYGLEKD